MAEVPENVAKGVARIVEDEGLELVAAEWHRMPRKGVLRLFIDKPKGVGIDDCERISKLVGDWLDVEDPFTMAYDLEVASPGLDRLFYKTSDYKKFEGRKVRVMLNKAVDGTKLYIGNLVRSDEESATIIEADRQREYTFRFPDIRWTRLEVEL